MDFARVYYCDGVIAEMALDKIILDRPAEHVDILLDACVAHEGEDGYFVLNNRLIRFSGHSEGSKSAYGMMHFYGAKTPRGCVAVIIDGLWEQHAIVVEKSGDEYRIFARFQLDGLMPEEKMSVKVVPLTGGDANYSGMARAYRAHQLAVGACVPLKARLNPELDYVLDAPEVRIRMGWKPVPTPVEEQTRETEPELHVALTFDDVGRLMDECKAQGVDKAEFCLVGWNVKGHDGRWPETFPVEPAFGGEEALRRLIQNAEALGYRIVCHTNSTDCYHIADVWSDALPIRRRNGELAKNAQWGGGRMYDLCPKMDEFSVDTLRGVAALGFRGIHYIDVISTVPPRRCFSPEHPCSQREFIAHCRKLAQFSREQIGGFQSEGGYDFMAAELDMALYVDFNIFDTGDLFCDENVPMWQLVYHDIILSNPGTATVNYTAKDWRSRLKFIEYGGRPVTYVYSKFVEGNHWMGEDDYDCDSPVGIARTARDIRRQQDEYRRMGELRTLAMVEHARVGDIATVTYENGAQVVCNYGESDVEIAGIVIPAHDFGVISN